MKLKIPKNLKVKVVKFFNKKTLFGLGIVVLVVALYFGKSLFVAALVNGRPVFRLSVVHDLEAQGGKSVLENLVEKSLVLQELKKNNIKISNEVVNSEIQKIEDLFKNQTMTLDQALAARGQSRKVLAEQIRLQKGVESILSSKIVVSEEEIKAYFDKNKEIFGKNAKLEAFKEQVNSEIFQQKLSSEYSKWITELKTKAKINYFISY